MYSRTLRSAAVAAAGLLTLTLGTAAPAAAHTAPKRGSVCAISGMAKVNHGKVYLCTSRTEGAKPRWDGGRTISRSRLAITDGWAKAAPSGMSAAFGILRNPTSRPIRVIGAYSRYSTAVQLHEVVQQNGSMVMQQKTGGFVVPAGGRVELKPGGNHLMFLRVTKPITAGALIPITLVTSDGGLLRTKVLGKVFMGANEDYAGSSAASGSSTMSGM